ncbi:MAG: spinster family MFS transporter [Pseudomonadales bacterium]
MKADAAQHRGLRSYLQRKSWYRWYAVGVLTLVYASSQVDRQIMGMLLEPIRLELGASDTAMGFLVGLTFAIFYATLGMPIAMLADRSNRRNIITIAISIWSGMTVLCGYAQTFTQMALARIGVGIGEAGSTPPSHSIISDLFPPETRGTAMGIFALGVNFGLLIAYLGGGWISENYGWRTTFVVVGLPGLLIALLLYATVSEPRRGASEQKLIKPVDDNPTDADQAPAFATVARHMWRVRSTRHLTIGAALAGFIGYGFTLWMPTFLIRSHGLSPTEVGLTLALMTGLVGAMGTFTAGKLADVLARRDERWRTWVVAAAKGGYVPFLAGVFMVDDLTTALILYVVPAFFGGFYLAPTFALIQSLVTLRMRALASSIVLFVLNIIGMGFGPQLVGIMSDWFAPEYGKESLRMALFILTFLNLWCAYHYFTAARTLHQDMASTSNNAA